MVRLPQLSMAIWTINLFHSTIYIVYIDCNQDGIVRFSIVRIEDELQYQYGIAIDLA